MFGLRGSLNGAKKSNCNVEVNKVVKSNNMSLSLTLTLAAGHSSKCYFITQLFGQFWRPK